MSDPDGSDYDDIPSLVSDSDDSGESDRSAAEIAFSSVLPPLLMRSDDNSDEDNGDNYDDDHEDFGKFCNGCTCGCCHESESEDDDYDHEYDDDDDSNYDDDENDKFDDDSTVLSETSSNSNGDMPALIPVYNPESPMYYCHICARDISVQLSDDGYPSCNSCHNSFVEILGQGLFSFLRPSNNGVNPNRVNVTSSDISHPPRMQVGNVSGGRVRENNQPSRIGIIVRRGGGSVECGASGGTTQAAVRTGRAIQLFLGGGSNHPVVSSILESIVGNVNRNRISRSLDELLSHIITAVNSNAGTPPASQSIIDSLERETLTEHSNLLSSGEVCSISLETFKVGDQIVKLPCGHNFIEEPIVTWLKSHDSCPTCRIRVSE